MSICVHAAVALLILACFVVGAPGLNEVVQLTAEPDFKSITLRWEYARSVPILYGFQINYCEMQAWGPNRCRTKVIDNPTRDEVQPGGKRDYQAHSAVINGLRMSTNYSLEVRPLEGKKQTDSKFYGKRIIVPTKGFSAKASLCLPDVSEVEVSTGPHFGGRISVEPADGGKEDHCAVRGDANSAQDSYILRIEHKLCGSKVNRTTVATFILVQENLPILTHSTRRFLVLCTFQPETLTVRAGINLPHSRYSVTTMPPNYGSYHVNDVNGNEVSGNDVHAAALRQIQDPQIGRQFNNDESEARTVMVVLLMLVVTSAVGLGLVVSWYFPKIKPTRQFDSSSSSIASDDTVSISAFDNYSNSLRDNISITDSNFAATLDESSNPNLPFSEGVFNEVLCEMYKNKITSRMSSEETETTVSIETGSQSEAEC